MFIYQLRNVEKELFFNINLRDQTLNELIKQSKEINYLDMMSYRKHKTDCNWNEIDFCLDLYNKFREDNLSKFTCKRLALLETVNFIESRYESFYWDYKS
jgi:hypothetical protein